MVVRMARENPSWGYDRIVEALSNPGHEISDQTVGNILQRHGIPPALKRCSTSTWKDFVASHMAVLAGVDFFTVEVLTWRGFVTHYVLFFLHLESRRVTSPGSQSIQQRNGWSRLLATPWMRIEGTCAKFDT